MTSYATIAELRTQTDKQDDDSGRPWGDVNIQLVLDAATSGIDNFCKEPDGFVAASSASARVFPGSGTSYQFIDNCVAITLVETKRSPTDTVYDAWLTAEWNAFRGDPESPEFNSLSWTNPKPVNGILATLGGNNAFFTSGRLLSIPGFTPDPDRAPVAVPTVRVTAKWGYAVVVPPVIKQACLAQAVRWMKRGEGAWADTLSSSNLDQLMFKKELDPEVKWMLVSGGFVRPVVGRR